MNIYIPVRDFTELDLERVGLLHEHTVHVVCTKPISIESTKTPRIRPEFNSIKEQKNRILSIGFHHDYFVMLDSDIEFDPVVFKELEDGFKHNYDYGMMCAPYEENNKHIHSACTIVRGGIIKRVEYSKGCFCSALSRSFVNRGFQAGSTPLFL